MEALFNKFIFQLGTSNCSSLNLLKKKSYPRLTGNEPFLSQRLGLNVSIFLVVTEKHFLFSFNDMFFSAQFASTLRLCKQWQRNLESRKRCYVGLLFCLNLFWLNTGVYGILLTRESIRHKFNKKNQQNQQAFTW